MSMLVSRVMLCAVVWAAVVGNAASRARAEGPDGFATVGGQVTGGAGGKEVVVTTGDDLNQYTDAAEPYIIYIKGTVTVDGMSTHVRPNKTILGLGADATLEGGGLYLYNSSNVIIRNLNFHGSTDDGIGMLLAHNVWVDHCTFRDSEDGSMDMRRASDNITVSWCKFAYSAGADHALACLLGSNDKETVNLDKLHITFHHNWFAENVKERMPSIRFGTVHAYNNYYSSTGNNYCIRVRLNAQARIENNIFDGVKNPWEVYITDPAHVVGKAFAKDNLETNVTWGKSTKGDDGDVVIVPGTDEVFTPPYEYAAEPAESVKDAVTSLSLIHI